MVRLAVISLAPAVPGWLGRPSALRTRLVFAHPGLPRWSGAAASVH